MKNRKISLYIILIISIFIIQNGYAQVSEKHVGVTVYDQRYFININENQDKEPLWRSKFRPFVQLNYQKYWKTQKLKNKFYHNAQIGFSKYRYIDLGVNAMLELGYEKRFFNNIALGAAMGGGVQSAWKDHTYQIYENENWVTKNDRGTAMIRPMTHLAFKTDFPIAKQVKLGLEYRIQVFFNYNIALEAPLIPAQQLGISLKYNLDTKK